MDGTLDGTDKAHVDATNGLAVDVKALPAHVDIRHLNATDDTIAVSAGTALIGKVSIDQSTANANEVVVKTLPAVTATNLDIRHLNATDDVVVANLSATDNAVLDAIALAVGTEGDALGDGVLMQGDDGTDRTNVLVDTDGHLQVDVLSNPSQAVTNADITTVAGAVAGGHMQVDVLTAPSTAVTNADITTVAGAVAAGHMQVDVLTAPSTTVTATHLDTRHLNATDDTLVLAAGTAAIGKLAANSGVDIGDVDVTSLPSLAAGTALIGKVGIDQATANANEVVVKNSSIAGSAGTANAGVISVQGIASMTPVAVTMGVGGKTIWRTAHDETAAQTDHEIQAAPAGSLCLYLTDFFVTNDSTLAITIKFIEDTASAKTSLTGVMKIPKDGGITMSFVTPIKLTANKNLGITSTGTSNFSVFASGYTAL